MPNVKSSLDKVKSRIHKTKWKSLKKRGIRPPANAQEAKERLKAAHGY